MTAWREHGTASIVALRPMLGFARTRGVDVDDVLREMNVPASAIDDYDLRIPEAKRLFAWTEVPAAPRIRTSASTRRRIRRSVRTTCSTTRCSSAARSRTR